MKVSWSSSLEWDNKSTPHLHIASVSFLTSLSAAEENCKIDGLSQTRFLPPTQSHVIRLADDVRALKDLMQRTNAKTKWLVGLIGLLILLAISFKH